MSNVDGGGGGGPKLYTNKPKKSQQQKQGKEFSTPAAPNPNHMDLPPPSSSGGGGVPTPLPPPSKESFARRYKFVWPVLLTVNLAIGGYLFLRTNKKNNGLEDGEAAPDAPSNPAVTSTPAASSVSPVPEKPLTSPLTEPIKVREPIPEQTQKELFKWILEEKRKVKPKDPEEKKRIDEEKAILKQFIREKSIPSL
ncbi:hypothetical protein AQUCO_00100094v1 [Aquilegia coerulea]|uniref:Uncharacterized protein n=2 Tax=Aquilegia coerulea TaxID=218851 RepID=A0A2G5F8T4_AQUCA|nr:hypothetical protein AQUCO_00100094v1 [Aquilegia coerulea]